MIIPEGGVSKQSLLLQGISVDQEDPVKTGSDLPSYVEHSRGRNAQITYTFIPQTNPANSMIMEIPRYAEGAYAKYYVSVNLNCFTPTSFITTIRKGGWEGDVMGDFEMALSKSGTMCFKGFECPIGEVMSSKMFRNPGYYWKSQFDESREVLELYWAEESSSSTAGMASSLVCYLGKEKPLTNAIAKFIPGSLPRRPGRAAMRTRLQVEPNGLDHVDEIVMSLWIVERTRTLPSGIMKDLF
ncbi:hypothetical protein BJ165DRAFT_1522054 [Panaeolus papilionaceus]|nr:hypothetical protein BJ165DRAFT_1522054 [Panaeolus papilionaceus]